MDVRVAKHAGFCPGVRRATEVAEKAAIESKGKIFTIIY